MHIYGTLLSELSHTEIGAENLLFYLEITIVVLSASLSPGSIRLYSRLSRTNKTILLF